MSKPTIVFVHGAWHNSSIWALCNPRLISLGYPVLAVHLPSTQNPLQESFDSDVDVIRDAIAMASETGDVVLAMHSYGGVPGSEAAKGMGKNDGGKGRLVRLVYIASFAAPKGMNIVDDMAPWIRVDGDVCIATQPEHYFYNDIEPEAQKYWIRQLGKQALGAFRSRVTYEAYRDFDTTYLECEKDNAIPIWLQKQLCEKGGIKDVRSCGASHSPMLSMPDFVVEVLTTPKSA